LINAIIVISYARKEPAPHTGFEVTGSACTSIDEARQEIEGDNDEEQDINNKLVAYFPIDQTDLGLQAFAAVLSLAIEADHEVQGVGIENLLTQLFMSGFTHGVEKMGASNP